MKKMKTPILTQKEFDKIYEQGKEALYALFQSLMSRIEELEGRLEMNSTNSSKPPSSDGLSKPRPKNLRESTGKTTGGQKGHEGKTLGSKETPDIIVRHEPHQCSCGCSLEDVPGTVIQRRQIADLPKIELEYTEHQVIEKKCPNCHQTSQGKLPEGIEDTAVQYGPGVYAMLVYLSAGQYLSYERIVEMCEALFGFAPSEGTVHTAMKNCYERLESFEEEVKEKLKSAEVLHCDLRFRETWVYN
jgi:transposase